MTALADERPEDSRLVRAAGELWIAATRAPFLEAAQDGSLPAEAFTRWLVQDYHFAAGLTVFEGTLVARSERPAQSLFIRGLAALDEELSWFETEARARGLDLAAPVHPVCRRYVDFLLRAAHEESLPGLYAVLYGVEVAYLAAWSALRPEGPYADVIARWSSAAFREDVLRLQALAEAVEDSSTQPLFNEVLRHERDFWAMAWGVDAG